MATNINELPWPLRIVIAIFAGALVYAGGYYWWVQDAKTKNVADQAILDRIRARNNLLRQNEPLLVQVNSQIAALQLQIKQTEKVVPAGKDVSGFITVMQDTANSSGIALRYLKPQAVVERDPYYGEMPFNIQIDGSYFAILSFFDRISKLERIVNMENIRVGSIAKNGAGGYAPGPGATVMVTCVARTFYSRAISK